MVGRGFCGGFRVGGSVGWRGWLVCDDGGTRGLGDCLRMIASVGGWESSRGGLDFD